MYNKLSRKELRIIEETKRQGEQQDGGKKPSRWSLIRSLIWLVVFFTALAIGIRLMLALING